MATIHPVRSALKKPTNPDDEQDQQQEKKKLQWADTVNDNGDKNSAKSFMKKSNVNTSTSKKKKRTLCAVCGIQPAALTVRMVVQTKEQQDRRKKKPLCLLHYYTTMAVHEGGEFVNVHDADTVQQQVNNNGVQDLFAEAFVQLQQELAQESLNIAPTTTASKNPRKAPPAQDPLAILHDLHRNTKKKRKQPPPQGGFLRHVPVPERLRKTQQEQAKLQATQLARMKRAALDTSKRREPTRKSIWNAVMDDPSPSVKTKPIRMEDDTVDATCSCGSTNVSSLGNVTSRNQDVRKGEVWGSGDRSNDDVILKYQCNQCGKMWQESG
ncbi:expressed unknown protein [Seminavis robusta]|uniref:Uncharacterized protein n=1 Tax=Seminavis robusta TaxID=568900 RepID=A0A9N8D4Z7_9STRA|nr:expressed unknown protein [Seminavis robusta]|eukprot:Sro6_g005330.1 n/a (325) ;mRNA; r:158312-159286